MARNVWKRVQWEKNAKVDRNVLRRNPSIVSMVLALARSCIFGTLVNHDVSHVAQSISPVPATTNASLPCFARIEACVNAVRSISTTQARSHVRLNTYSTRRASCRASVDKISV